MSSLPPSVSDTPVLKLLNVESAYGPIKAIRGVSLQVRRGEIATVLGSNGAGKTTILKTISGIIDPRKGSIEFKGQDITAKDPAFIVQQGLSHVPEGREVFPLLSRSLHCKQFRPYLSEQDLLGSEEGQKLHQDRVLRRKDFEDY